MGFREGGWVETTALPTPAGVRCVMSQSRQAGNFVKVFQSNWVGFLGWVDPSPTGVGVLRG